MNMRKFIAPLILVFGLLFYLLTQDVASGTHEKYDLAEWTKVQTQNMDKLYAIQIANTKDLGLNLDEVVGHGQRQLGGQYVLLYQRSMPTYLGSEDKFFCGDVAGFAIYEDILTPQKYLTFSFNHKLSFKGCAPSIRTAILVEFQDKNNA